MMITSDYTKAAACFPQKRNQAAAFYYINNDLVRWN